MSSSVREKIIEQIRAAKRNVGGAENAVEAREEPRGGGAERVAANVGGVSAKAGSGDSPKPKRKAPAKKPAAKKAAKKG